jgi:hypothetical protein
MKSSLSKREINRQRWSDRIEAWKQSGQSAPLAGQGTEPELLPGSDQCAAGTGLAGGSSQLLEANRTTNRFCVTRRLLVTSQ